MVTQLVHTDWCFNPSIFNSPFLLFPLGFIIFKTRTNWGLKNKKRSKGNKRADTLAI